MAHLYSILGAFDGVSSSSSLELSLLRSIKALLVVDVKGVAEDEVEGGGPSMASFL